MNEVAFLRAELHKVRDKCDRLQPQVQTSTTDEDEGYIEKHWDILIKEVQELEVDFADILIKDVKELKVDFAVLITLFVLLFPLHVMALLLK